MDGSERADRPADTKRSREGPAEEAQFPLELRPRKRKEEQQTHR
jgi:hypothetical protein